MRKRRIDDKLTLTPGSLLTGLGSNDAYVSITCFLMYSSTGMIMRYGPTGSCFGWNGVIMITVLRGTVCVIYTYSSGWVYVAAGTLAIMWQKSNTLWKQGGNSDQLFFKSCNVYWGGNWMYTSLYRLFLAPNGLYIHILFYELCRFCEMLPCSVS